MNMRERIANGELFLDNCEGLQEERLQAKKRMLAFNQTSPDDLDTRFALLEQIFGKKVNIWVERHLIFVTGLILKLAMNVI